MAKNQLKTIEDLQKVYEEVYVEDLEKMKGLKSIDFTFYSKTNGIIANNGNGFGTSAKIYNFQKDIVSELKNVTVPQTQNPPVLNIYVDNDALRTVYFVDKNDEQNEDLKVNFNKNLPCEIKGKKAAISDFNPLKNTTSSISAECFKKALYNDYSHGLNNCEDATILLTNPKTLLNGFVNTSRGAVFRTGSVNMSDLSSAFLKEVEKEDLTKWKEVLGEDLTLEHFKNNGALKLKNYSTSGEKNSTSLYSKFEHILQTVFYKASGSLNLEQLQFITIGKELGRDSLGESTEEEIAKIHQMLIFTLNLIKKNLQKEFETNTSYLAHKTLRKLKEFMDREEVNVETGRFRKLGSIVQKTDDVLLERGFLLNKSAIATLALFFFNLLLKTTIENKKAKLEVVKLMIEEDLTQDFDLTIFYEKVLD